MPASAVAEPPAEPAQASAGEKRELRLTFHGESWVEVKDAAGTIITSRLNDPGSERVVRASPPVTVVIGNASGVTLSYRGKPVDLEPHTREGVARVTLE
jgi:cytoskeleton protein RodZ